MRGALAGVSSAMSEALRDPGDRAIVATSRIVGLPRLTHDRAILRPRLAARWRIA